MKEVNLISQSQNESIELSPPLRHLVIEIEVACLARGKCLRKFWLKCQEGPTYRVYPIWFDEACHQIEVQLLEIEDCDYDSIAYLRLSELLQTIQIQGTK